MDPKYAVTFGEDKQQQRAVITDGVGMPPAPLSDYAIQMIHSGLLIPNAAAIRSMAREIRKWRGVADPDAV